jgi:adenylosuccinate synthase
VISSIHATIVVGLAYGDCGKGTIVDYLARSSHVHTVVRFNGGPQAGHNVATTDGRHHTFSQFGSGTLAGPHVATLLSRFMLIEPYSLLNEGAHLQEIGCVNIWERLFIDARCVAITPPHQAANRLRELARGDAAHGTCGLGVGEATADAIDRPDLILRAGDFADADIVARKLRAITAYKSNQLKATVEKLRAHSAAATDIQTLEDTRWIEIAVDACAAVAGAGRIMSSDEVDAVLRTPGEIVFEGAQGALLDEDFGFHPHTTWSKTTSANAIQLLRESGVTSNPRRIGVLRSYFTRHGPGPFVSEDFALKKVLSEPHNSDAGHQGHFRVGVFDAVAARYAISFAGVDEIALTHLDRLPLLPSYFCSDYQAANSQIKAEDEFRIPHAAAADTKQRELLTRAINRCKPIYREFDKQDSASFVELIQAELQMPVGLISSGPTAADKTWLPR